MARFPFDRARHGRFLPDSGPGPAACRRRLAPPFRGRVVSGAVKQDAGKLRYSLIPPAALAEVARAYTVGAAKYGDHNYLLGMAWSRVFDAMQRHAQSWLAGERRDPQDGQHPLASVVFCAMTLMEYERLGIGTDDRVFARPEREAAP